MRVLVVTHGFPPEQAAGAELYAAQLAAELQRSGDRVTVLCPGRRSAPEYSIVEERFGELPVLRLVQNFRAQWNVAATYEDESLERAFAGVLDRVRPDAVHFHHVAGLSVRCVPLAARRAIPVAVTLHDFWPLCARGQRRMPSGQLCADLDASRCARCVRGKRARYAWNHARGSWSGRTPASRGERAWIRTFRWPLRQWSYVRTERGAAAMRRREEVMRRSLSEADWLLCPSRFLLNEYLRHRYPAARLRHWPYGVDRGLFGRASGTSSPTPDSEPSIKRFAFLGSLQPSKGVDLVVDAISRLPAGTARLTVHGAAPPGQEAYVRALRERASADVDFAGPFEHADVGRIFAAMDVLVFPSRWYENAPLTLLESVLAGVPSVVADQGGMREFAEEFGTARCFSPGDVDSLARVLAQIIDEGDRLSPPSARAEVRSLEDDAHALGALLRSTPQRAPAEAGP